MVGTREEEEQGRFDEMRFNQWGLDENRGKRCEYGVAKGRTKT